MAEQIKLPQAEHRLCARVARLYYESEMTQEQIGEFLGLSRMKVNRLLSLAMKSGIVQVQIIGPDDAFADLEGQLLSAFRLKDVRVIASPLPGQSMGSALAAGASEWLSERLEPDLTIGIGLGRTVALMPQSFSVNQSMKCQFLTLEGVGASPNAGFAAYDVTSRLAEAAGGWAEVISAPTFVSTPEMREALIAEPSVAASLKSARGANIMLQSVGTVSADAPLFRHGTLPESDLPKLKKAGAVGDALGHFFNVDGVHIPWSTDAIHVGLTLDDLRACPMSAVVAGGPEKLPAIRAGIRGGFMDALITDSTTAERLMELGL